MTDADLKKSIKLEERTQIRKGLNALRREGYTPGVIHNHGQESVHVMAKEMDLTKVVHAAGGHHALDLTVGEQKYLALIKDAHFNPVKKRLEHVVFQAINRNEKVEAEVPIHLEGDAPAEKVGFIVLRQLDTVQIEAFPRNLPDSLKADAGKLAELHDKITVADLEVPEGVTILTEADHPIATVAETRAQVAEEAAAEGEEGTAEDEDSTDGNALEGAEKDAAGQQSTGKSGE
jgi:large subunit ribosomal protein L25